MITKSVYFSHFVHRYSFQAPSTVIGWLGQPLKRSCRRCPSHWLWGLSSTTARTSSSVASVSPLVRGAQATWNQLTGHSSEWHRDTHRNLNKVFGIGYRDSFTTVIMGLTERQRHNYQWARTGQAMPTYCSTYVFPVWCIGHTQRLVWCISEGFMWCLRTCDVKIKVSSKT